MDNKSYQDHYFRKAKLQGYRSRSAFKLIELNQKFKFLRNGIKLLDVGSFPGGWCQVAVKIVKNGKILGIDIKKINEIKGVNLIEGDFLDENSKNSIIKFFNNNINVILSDMAPNLSGIKVVDRENIFRLVNVVLDFSLENLHKNGCLVVKAFETGIGSREFRKKLAKYFDKVWLRKPLASKKVSAEQFLIAKTLK